MVFSFSVLQATITMAVNKSRLIFFIFIEFLTGQIY
jgi:hypothetical protein